MPAAGKPLVRTAIFRVLTSHLLRKCSGALSCVVPAETDVFEEDRARSDVLVAPCIVLEPLEYLVVVLIPGCCHGAAFHKNLEPVWE